MIARELEISPRTVEIHRSRVMKKMHCPSLAHLVRALDQVDYLGSRRMPAGGAGPERQEAASL